MAEAFQRCGLRPCRLYPGRQLVVVALLSTAEVRNQRGVRRHTAAKDVSVFVGMHCRREAAAAGLARYVDSAAMQLERVSAQQELNVQ